ncbi:MAG: (Fe-S)-binding protein, partial [Polyangiaceae bacterium]|nr:(Fe-S)-binding protein [Polyangiaceae bacterium]
MTILLVTTLSFFSWSAFRRFRQVKIGVPDPTFDLRDPEQLADRAKATLIYVLFQKKMPNYTLAGFAHIGIFIAFQVLLLNSIMLWFRGFDPNFDFWGLLDTSHVIGKGYSFIKELAAAAAVLGALAFWYIRLV